MQSLREFEAALEIVKLFRIVQIAVLHLYLIWTPVQFLERAIVLQRRTKTPATPEMELFLRLDNGYKPLTNATKRFILNASMALLDPPLWNSC